MVKIIDDAVMPKGRFGTVGINETLRSMSVGQSFVVPTNWNFQSVKTSAYSMDPLKFKIRTMADGSRCVWRVK